MWSQLPGSGTSTQIEFVEKIYVSTHCASDFIRKK